MKLRDFLSHISDEFLDTEAAGFVVVLATAGTPIVVASHPPPITLKLLSLVLNDGNWSNTIEHKAH